MNIKIFIIDDDLRFVHHLSESLASHPMMAVVGVAATLKAALEAMDEQPCDVYLVDLNLPDGSGIDAIEHIRKKYLHAKIIILSTLGGEENVLRSIQAGADSYILKSELPENISESIIKTINNGAQLTGRASLIVIQQLRRLMSSVQKQPFSDQDRPFSSAHEQKHPTRKAMLTSKEIEILRHVKMGLSAKQVAAGMHISIHTVNQHLRNIYQKLSSRNKMEAIQRAVEMGLIADRNN